MDDEQYCWFCGKRRKDVNILIASRVSDACICDQCVRDIATFIAEEKKRDNRRRLTSLRLS